MKDYKQIFYFCHSHSVIIASNKFRKITSSLKKVRTNPKPLGAGTRIFYIKVRKIKNF